MPTIGMILLAAGGSTRLGRPKQMLRYRGRTLLRRAADAAIASTCDPIVCVLGADADRMRQELAGLPLHITLNEQWSRGMGGSIRVGAAELLRLAPDITGAIVMLCDQPLVDTASLRRLVEAHGATGKPICAAAYQQTLGSPCLFAHPYLTQLLSIRDDEGGKTIISRAAGDHVHAVPLPEATIDVDTNEDYLGLQ